MADPLAPYRKGPGLGRGGFAAPPAPAPPDQPPEAYLAFATKDKVDRLKIRPAMSPWRAPSYVHLLDVTSDGPFGKNFTLIFTILTVLVRGRNLQAVVAALESGNAEFIQQYYPDLWPPPADGAPVIELLEIHASDPGIAALERKIAAEAKAKT